MDLPTMGKLPLLVSFLSAFAVFTIIFGLSREYQRRRNRLADRLRQLEIQRRGLAQAALPDRETGQLVAALNQIAHRAGLDEQLSRAGVPLTAGEFILIVAILLGVGLILSIALHNIFLFMMLVAATIWGPRAWIASRKAKRTRDFDAQLPSAIQLIASSMRAGNSNIAIALRLAAQESKPPISKEFQIVVQQVEWGASIKDALVSMTERVPSTDLQLLVQAISIQMESGGNLVQMLENISETIRERVRLAGEVKALTAQGKYSGYVVALMPVAISALLFIFNPNYILGVFRTTTWCGFTMFAAAAVMILIGMAVVRRIVDIKV